MLAKTINQNSKENFDTLERNRNVIANYAEVDISHPNQTTNYHQYNMDRLIKNRIDRKQNFSSKR